MLGLCYTQENLHKYQNKCPFAQLTYYESANAVVQIRERYTNGNKNFYIGGGNKQIPTGMGINKQSNYQSFQARCFKLTIFQCYAATNDHEEAAKYRFYNMLNCLIADVPKHDLFAVMGD